MQNTIITGTTGVLGLIGNPVRHTMSPMIHNTLSEELGQDLRYLPFPVEEDVTAAVRGAYHLGIRGLNVTVPHKTAVMEALAEVDDSAPTAVMRDDSAPTQVLDPDAADATTLLEVTDPQQANANEGSQLKQVVEEERIPDNFEIVRKIVLTDSTEFIRPEQGEQYA